MPLVQSITGHKSLSQLQGYLHATDDRRHVIAEAYEAAAEVGATSRRHLRLVK